MSCEPPCREGACAPLWTTLAKGELDRDGGLIQTIGMIQMIDALAQGAIELPPDQRFALAQRILASMEPEEAAGIDDAWTVEIQERIRKFDAGETKGIPGAEVFAEIDRRLPEVRAVLVGELAVLVLLAIPGGLLFGRGLALLIMASFSTETVRLPILINNSTYAIAVVVVLTAAVCSFALVSRMLAKLDLVGVLKARD